METLGLEPSSARPEAGASTILEASLPGAADLAFAKERFSQMTKGSLATKLTSFS